MDREGTRAVGSSSSGLRARRPGHPGDTLDITPEEAAQQVYLFLKKEGYIGVVEEERKP